MSSFKFTFSQSKLMLASTIYLSSSKEDYDLSLLFFLLCTFSPISHVNFSIILGLNSMFYCFLCASLHPVSHYFILGHCSCCQSTSISNAFSDDLWTGTFWFPESLKPPSFLPYSKMLIGLKRTLLDSKLFPTTPFKTVLHMFQKSVLLQIILLVF